MTDHVKKIVSKCSALVKLKSKQYVLDIGSNDATLLNFYANDIIKVGVDPLVNKYKKFYKKLIIKFQIFLKLKI